MFARSPDAHRRKQAESTKVAHHLLKAYGSFVAWFRRRHYRIFRRAVENRHLYRALTTLARHWSRAVDVYAGRKLFINPIFHSAFLTRRDVEGYEPDVGAALVRMIRHGDCFYDIGANVGVFSLLVADLVGRDGEVFAFEPAEVNLVCLRKKIFK